MRRTHREDHTAVMGYNESKLLTLKCPFELIMMVRRRIRRWTLIFECISVYVCLHMRTFVCAFILSVGVYYHLMFLVLNLKTDLL